MYRIQRRTSIEKMCDVSLMNDACGIRHASNGGGVSGGGGAAVDTFMKN